MLKSSEASIEQCRLNLVAVLDYHHFPACYDILAAQPDRLLIQPGEFAFSNGAQLEQLPFTGAIGKHLDELLKAGVFQGARLNRKLHGPTALWTVRETVPFGSMQITGHCSQAYASCSMPTWELDLDHGNPAWLRSSAGHQDVWSLLKGVAALVTHGCEVAYPGKTNPWWMRERLLKRGIQVALVDG